jgi:hypothetical protein
VCGLEEAVHSMAFVEALYHSSHAGGKQIDVQQLFSGFEEE